MAISFSEALDPTAAADVRGYAVKVWGLKRSAKYGSDHVNEQALPVAKAVLSDDGRTVFLDIPGIRPTQGMEIRCRLAGQSGERVDVTIHNTIHALPH